MQIDKIRSLIGFANKAGKISSGSVIEKDIKKKKVKLLLIDEDVSKNTLKEFVFLCEKFDVKYILLEKDLICNAIGKFRIAIAILDNNFAKSIIDFYENL